MRTLATFAITIAMACLASTANATSLIDLVYTGGSTAAGGTGGTAIDANPSDVLSFDVIVFVDSAGIAGLGFDVGWDDPPLVLTGQNWVTGTIITSFAPFTSVSPNPGGPNLTGPSSIGNIGWFGLPPSPSSTQVFLGSMTFHVSGSNPNVFGAGFFATDGSSATNGSGTFITPNFASFTVNPVPEPGLAALMGLGLLGLALAGRRTKK